MKRLHYFFAAAAIGMAFSTPAAASAGLACKTTQGPERAFAFFAGHHAAAMWAGSERIGDEWVAVEVGQQWTDDKRLFLDIIDGEKLERLARIMTTREDDWVWRGTIVTADGEQPIECQEN